MKYDKKVMLFDLNGVLTKFVGADEYVESVHPGTVEGYERAYEGYNDVSLQYSGSLFAKETQWLQHLISVTMYETALDIGVRTGKVGIKPVEGAIELLEKLRDRGISPRVFSTSTENGIMLSLEEAGLHNLVDRVYSSFALTPEVPKFKTAKAFGKIYKELHAKGCELMGHIDDKLLPLMNAYADSSYFPYLFKVGKLTDADYKIIEDDAMATSAIEVNLSHHWLNDAIYVKNIDVEKTGKIVIVPSVRHIADYIK